MKGIKPENLTRENQMGFTEEECEKIGKLYDREASIGIYSGNIKCVVCNGGAILLDGVEKEESFPGREIRSFHCDKCGRNGSYPI